jgi:SAM-dependent methyltransferase
LNSDRFFEHPQRDIDFFESRIDIPHLQYRMQTLFDFISRRQPGSVLEVGCGEGIALQFLPALNYVGVDLSLVRLRFASGRYPGDAFIQGDAVALPFKSGMFDLVFCNGTLHHLSAEQGFEMVKDMARVCRRGGAVVIMEPNAYNPSSFLLGLLRKPERGIWHCKSKLFLHYFSRLGMADRLRLHYDDTFAPINLFVHFFRKRGFVKGRRFNRSWRAIDDLMKKVIPERFWADIIVVAEK